MTALSSDVQIERKEGLYLGYPVKASTTIYSGALVAVDANGWALPGADTAGLVFQGVANQAADNSSGSNGDKTVVVSRTGLWKLTLGSTISQANVGDKVYLSDDQTVDLAANTTNDVLVGVIAGFIDSTHAWVDIMPAICQ